eukprot:UN23397
MLYIIDSVVMTLALIVSLQQSWCERLYDPDQTKDLQFIRLGALFIILLRFFQSLALDTLGYLLDTPTKLYYYFVAGSHLMVSTAVITQLLYLRGFYNYMTKIIKNSPRKDSEIITHHLQRKATLFFVIATLVGLLLFCISVEDENETPTKVVLVVWVTLNISGFCLTISSFWRLKNSATKTLNQLITNSERTIQNTVGSKFKVQKPSFSDSDEKPEKKLHNMRDESQRVYFCIIVMCVAMVFIYIIIVVVTLSDKNTSMQLEGSLNPSTEARNHIRKHNWKELVYKPRY